MPQTKTIGSIDVRELPENKTGIYYNEYLKNADLGINISVYDENAEKLNTLIESTNKDIRILRYTPPETGSGPEYETLQFIGNWIGSGAVLWLGQTLLKLLIEKFFNLSFDNIITKILKRKSISPEAKLIYHVVMDWSKKIIINNHGCPQEYEFFSYFTMNDFSEAFMAIDNHSKKIQNNLSFYTRWIWDRKDRQWREYK